MHKVKEEKWRINHATTSQNGGQKKIFLATQARIFFTNQLEWDKLIIFGLTISISWPSSIT